MSNIYEIKNEFNTLWSILEDELVDDEALMGAWETAQEDLALKLENCCKYIKNEEAVIAGLKEEEERLNARRKAKENAIKRLKALMQDAMIAAGEKKIPCGTFTVSIQANPPKVVLDVTDINAIPEEYLTMPEPEVNKAKIKDSLKAGYECDFAHLESTLSLRIR